MTRRNQFRALGITLAYAWLTAGVTFAAVTTTGLVDPLDPEVWTSSTTANIGKTAEGSVTINGGSQIASGYSYLGSSGGSGTATVNGVGSAWNNSGDFNVGAGILAVENGATVVSNQSTFLGVSLGDEGTAIVTGTGSTLNTTGIFLGAARSGPFGGPSTSEPGVGVLRIEDGARVNSSGASIGFSLSGSGARGEVTVTGAGSFWDNSRGFIYVGDSNGIGTLDIQGGALVKSVTGYLGYGLSSNGSSGEVNVTGAGSTWYNSKNLEVGYYGTGQLTIADGGLVEVEGLINLAAGSSSSGSIGTISLNDGGALRLHGEKIQRGAGVGAATFNFNGGRLEGVGTYQVGAGLTQNGGVLAPGNSAGVTTIVGSYALNEGVLEIDLLSSAAAGVGFDRLVVNSGVTLGASSQLNLLLGYAANVGDSFLIVDSKNASAINGTFANDDALIAEFESLRYSFSLSYTAGTGNDIAVTVASVTLIGDYNADGFVDAADYTVWQDAVGTTVAAYAGADGNGDGVVDDGDHAVWAAHYGASLEAAMAQAVPEPAGVVLAALASVAGGRCRLASGRSVS